MPEMRCCLWEETVYMSCLQIGVFYYRKDTGGMNMSIKLRQYGIDGKWLIEIKDELWEFEDLSKMMCNLSTIVLLKDKYGRIDKRLFHGGV